MRKKFFLGCLLAVLLTGFLPVLVWAKEAPQVADEAGLLTEDEISALTDLIVGLESETGWDIMAATTADAAGKDATAYTELMFDQNCISDDGVICMIDMDNREIVLRTFGKAIFYLTDERIDGILDEAWEAVSDGSYKECLQLMLTGCGRAFEQGIPKDQYTYDEDTGEIIPYKKPRRITPLEAVVALVAALAAGGITAAAIIGKYRLKWGGYTYSCRENGSLTLTDRKDTLVNQVVTHRRIPRDPPKSSSGGSRSTVHKGVGGRTSGGGSRKF